MFEGSEIPEELLDIKKPQNLFYRIVIGCPVYLEDGIDNTIVSVIECDDLSVIKKQIENLNNTNPLGFFYETDFIKIVTNTVPINRWCIFDIDGNLVEEPK